MKLRNVLGVAAGTVGLTALANRLLTARAGTDEPLLAGDRRTYRWRGFDVDYVEAGDPADPDLVLFHRVGVGASNAEFRAVVDELADTHHVLAPDLPGFGRSDRPPLLYSASLLTTFVTDFLADLGDRPIAVASSLTGSYLAAAAREVPVERLVLVCPTDETRDGTSPLRRALVRTPLLGEAAFNAMASTVALRRARESRDFHDPDRIDPAVVEAEWATSHLPGARFAPASLLGGYLDPDEDLADVLAAVDAPTTLVWGRGSTDPPLDDGRDLAAAVDARLLVFEDSRRLPHAEHPGEFVDVLRAEYEAIET